MFAKSFKLVNLAMIFNKKEIIIQTIHVVVLEIVAVTLAFFLNQTYGQLYQAIQDYAINTIWLSIGKFSAMAMVLVFVAGYLNYFSAKLAFAIREGLTIASLGIMRKSLEERDINNFSQRVQEDFKKFGINFTDFWLAVLKAGLNLPIFIGVIMTLSSASAGLIIVAVTIAGTIATRLIARPIIKLQSEQESLEADFRTNLYMSPFATLKNQFLILNKTYKRLAFTQSGLGQMFTLLPFIVLMPLYIAKTVTMGAFFQSVNALGKVIDALSILIDNRALLVNIETCIIRINFMIEGDK